MNLKPLKGLFVFGAVVLATGTTALSRLEAKSVKAAYSLPDGFTVTAHSGCNGTKDNTLESFEAAIDSGADIIEMDVCGNENGCAVVTHDYEQGKEYPTFEEVLSFVKEKSDTVKINVDLKSADISFAADETIRTLGMTDRCFFTGVNEEDVQSIAATVSIPYYLNVHPTFTERFDKEYWIQTASKANMLGAIGINCNFRLISKKGVEICRKNSLLVSVFTPDSNNEVNFALTLSPDNITTRYPEYVFSKRRIQK